MNANIVNVNIVYWKRCENQTFFSVILFSLFFSFWETWKKLRFLFLFDLPFRRHIYLILKNAMHKSNILKLTLKKNSNTMVWKQRIHRSDKLTIKYFDSNSNEEKEKKWNENEVFNSKIFYWKIISFSFYAYTLFTLRFVKKMLLVLHDIIIVICKANYTFKMCFISICMWWLNYMLHLSLEQRSVQI